MSDPRDNDGWGAPPPEEQDYAPEPERQPEPVRQKEPVAEGQPEPPNNVEAEAALLGGLMHANETIDVVSSRVRADDFYEPLHERIYALMLELRSKGKAANPVTLRPYLINDPALTELGGMRYLAQLTGSGAALVGLTDFAEQIAELSALRKMIDTMRAGIERASNLDIEISPREVLSAITSELYQVGERTERVKVYSPASQLKMVLDRAQTMANGEVTGVECRNILDVSEVLGALEGGSYTVIGGRPSMGKSLLGQGMGWGFASLGEPGALISQEMSALDLSIRMAADLTFAMGEPVPQKTIKKNEMTPSEMAIVAAAMEKVEQMPLDIISPGRETIEDIEGRICRLAAKWERKGKKLKYFIIDYIQIMKTAKKFRDSREKIDYISERLLDLAKRLDCAAIVLAQLSRGVEARPDKRPMLSDLKESGRLEEDADNVVLVYRPEFYLQAERHKEGSKGYEEWDLEMRANRGKVDLIFSKVRHGQPTTRQCQFFGANQAIRGSAWMPGFMGEGEELI